MNAPASSPIAPALVLRDFPSWLPSMLVKELRQGLRTRGFVGALFQFQAAMVLMLFFQLATMSTAFPAAAMNGFFWLLISLQLLLFAPTRALGSIQNEATSRTLDLLLLTRLNAWRIVLGKWFAIGAETLLLLIAILPYGIVRYFVSSVDLVADAGRCLLLLAACALLVAAGLWTSGITKILRLVVVIALVFGAQGAIGIFSMFGSRSATWSVPAGLSSPIVWLDFGLVLAFLLAGAVRTIAAAAENHAGLIRGLPLGALLLVVLAVIAEDTDAATAQLVFTGVFLAIVGAIELAGGRRPMPSHWRAWRARGGLGRLVGPLALPGWKSAFLFVAVATALWAGCALLFVPTGTPASREQAEKLVWLALLAGSGLAFPAVLWSFVPRKPAAPGARYVGTLLAMFLLAGAGASLAASQWKITGLFTLAKMLPISAFLCAFSAEEPGFVVFSLRLLFTFAVFAGGFWQTRAHWQQLADFEARDRANRQF